MSLSTSFLSFVRSEKAGGIVLAICTAASLAITNYSSADLYQNFWLYEVAGHSILHWINDGLMTLFFLLIGLELEREIYTGELANLRSSLLPATAAIGGMLVPALVHFSLNAGSQYTSGFGIPMATDIAFALGVLSLLGNRVPTAMKIFVMAFAVIDDLCSIVIIALFYTDTIQWTGLGASIAIFALLVVLNRLGVRTITLYLAGGLGMWYFMQGSGIHPTVTGVLLAFAIPFKTGETKSPSLLLEHRLHYLVAFFVVPVFALANTAIEFDTHVLSGMVNTNTVGIVLGLVVGKPIGIVLFSYVALKLKVSSLPVGINLKHLTGAGFLGGIGFTMSIFITLLAFGDELVVMQSKIAVMLASIIAGTAGYLILRNQPGALN